MTIIQNLLLKAEAIDLSKRHAGRMTNYFNALATRGEWGKLVGYVKLSEAPKRIQIAIYEKIMLFTKFQSDDVTGQVLSFLATKTVKKPAKNHFKLIAAGDNVAYMNTPFTVLDDSTTTGKELLALWDKAVANKSLGSTDPKSSLKSQNPEQLKSVADGIVAALKAKNPSGSISVTIQKAEMKGSVAIAQIRDWGRWQLPEDIDPESEDAQDYDWEELSDSSYQLLMNFIKAARTKFPELTIDAHTEEKNWISITVGFAKK